MSTRADRHEFASDNTAPICPEALAALQQANVDAVPSYGEDRLTAGVCDRVREIFETDCDVFFGFQRHGRKRARSRANLPLVS